MDQDIVDSQKHEKAQEDNLGHKWAPKWDEEKEKYKDMPTATADFKLAGTEADIRMEVDALNKNL